MARVPPWASMMPRQMARPRPVPPCATGARGFDAVETFAQMGQVFRRNAFAGIRDGQTHSVADAHGRHGDLSRRRGMAQGIVQQVGQQAVEMVGIAVNVLCLLGDGDRHGRVLPAVRASATVAVTSSRSATGCRSSWSCPLSERASSSKSCVRRVIVSAALSIAVNALR